MVVTLDGDGQNDPQDIPMLWARLKKQTASKNLMLICGYRSKRQDSWLKKVASKIANKVRAGLLHDNTPDTGCGLKLINREAFLDLPYFDHMHRFITALIQRADWESLSVEVNHRPRNKGTSKYGLHNRLWVGIVDLIGVMWLQRRAKKPVYNEI